MAISFASGDLRWYSDSGFNVTLGCIAFWMKTTQTTVNTVLASCWATNSHTGFGFIMNNPANKMAVSCGQIAQTVALVGSTVINDGNWHHMAFNWNTANGGANNLYVDGALEAGPVNSSAAWSMNGTLCFGKSNDTFWAAYVGHMAEEAAWLGRNLALDEIKALAKGFSPLTMRPQFYVPSIRQTNDLLGRATSGSPVGTTFADHPRVLGQ